jgi:hypothetical protein
LFISCASNPVQKTYTIQNSVVENKLDRGLKDKGFIIDGKDCWLDISYDDSVPSCFYNIAKGDKILLSVENSMQKTILATMDLSDKCEINCSKH